MPNVPPEDALHNILNFLAHLAQYTTWGLFPQYFKLRSSHCPMYHMRTLCTIFKLSSPCLMYLEDAQYLNFLAHIAQCTIRGRFAPQCTIFKFLSYQVALHHILNLLAHIAQCTIWARFAPYYKLLRSHTWGLVAPYLNFLAHIAQCTIWGLFAPYFKLLSSPCPMYHLRLALHHILNFLAHLAQCTTWGRFAPYFKLLSSPCQMYHLRSLCTIF